MIKRTYLVTGATSGIGLACVRALSSKENIQLILLARNYDKLKQVKSTLPKNCAAEFISFDLHEQIDEVPNLAAALLKSSGFCGLIHCAGINAVFKIKDINLSILQKFQNIHLNSLILLTCELAKQKAALNLPQPIDIMAISSVNAVEPFAHYVPYGICKAALERAVRGLALDLSRYKMSINAVRLGAVDSPTYDKYKALYPDQKELNSFIQKNTRQKGGLISADECADFIVNLLLNRPLHLNGDILSLTAAYYG